MRLPELKFKIGADPSGAKNGAKEARDAFQSTFSDMAKRAATFAGTATAMWATFKAGALAAGVAASKTAVDINNLSRMANASTTEFQRWAIASKSVGVEQDKLSGILKDVTERAGEFAATGGGPMKDFFENIGPLVGVTADQFARLSGPEALQLYVTSLEKAGLSQQEMTYYLESMSGDMTALLPLLRNGGAEMTRLGDAAEATGKILSQDMIDGGVQLDRIFGEIADTLRTSATKAVLEHKDELIALANWVSETLIPALGDLMGVVGSIAQAFTDAIPYVQAFGRAVAGALDIGEGPVVEGDQPLTDQERADLLPNPEPSTTGTRPLDANGNVILDDGLPPLVTNVPPRVRPGSGDKSGKGGGKGGGGKGGADRLATDLERLVEQYATEQEMLDAHLEEQLRKLEEFREAKLIGEQDAAALEQQIREDHHAAMREIDRAAQQERLAAWGGALGDLSSLMSSKSKELFLVGKGAAMAQGAMDGYSAALSAWDKGMKIGGPPTAAMFATASAVRTAGMLASMASIQPGGGGGGGGGRGAMASAPSVPEQSQTKVANYQISGQVLGKQSTDELFKSINQGIKDGFTIHQAEWVG